MEHSNLANHISCKCTEKAELAIMLQQQSEVIKSIHPNSQKEKKSIHPDVPGFTIQPTLEEFIHVCLHLKRGIFYAMQRKDYETFHCRFIFISSG
jgi:hypothetical protein